MPRSLYQLSISIEAAGPEAPLPSDSRDSTSASILPASGGQAQQALTGRPPGFQQCSEFSNGAAFNAHTSGITAARRMFLLDQAGQPTETQIVVS